MQLRLRLYRLLLWVVMVVVSCDSCGSCQSHLVHLEFGLHAAFQSNVQVVVLALVSSANFEQGKGPVTAFLAARIGPVALVVAFDVVLEFLLVQEAPRAHFA